MRTQQEIDHMIRALRHERTMVPEENMFGQNNYTIIDAKIAILENRSDWDLSTDEAMDEFGDEGVSELQLCEDWMDGANCDAPASEEFLEATA